MSKCHCETFALQFQTFITCPIHGTGKVKILIISNYQVWIWTKTQCRFSQHSLVDTWLLRNIFQWVADDFPSWGLCEAPGNLTRSPSKKLRSEATHNRSEIRTLDPNSALSDQAFGKPWHILKTHTIAESSANGFPKAKSEVSQEPYFLNQYFLFLQFVVFSHCRIPTATPIQLNWRLNSSLKISSFQLQSASQDPSKLILLPQLKGSVCQRSKIFWPLRAMTTPKPLWRFMVSKSSSTRKPWCRGKGWNKEGDIPTHYNTLGAPLRNR